MRIAVNALSATNLSGPAVLLGHLGRLAAWTVGRHEFIVLHHRGNAGAKRELGENVTWIECAPCTANWLTRAIWEQLVLPARLKSLGADALFMASGTTVSTVRLPQIVMAMNPWALVREVHRGPAEAIKAAMQRVAYRNAVRTASMIFYISNFLREAYVANAATSERSHEIVYCGMDDDLLAAAAKRMPVEQRRNQIVSVSMMARHKDVETLVRAVAGLRDVHGIRPRLVLAGGWPDASYRAEMERLVETLALKDQIEMTGHLSRSELFRLYGESRVFSLMSRCESFGIPAVEAQCFGTPVVAANCCAAPEICGSGGTYPEPGDAVGASKALADLLSDSSRWNELSQSAVENSAKYRYETCAKPMMRVFAVER